MISGIRTLSWAAQKRRLGVIGWQAKAFFVQRQLLFLATTDHLRGRPPDPLVMCLDVTSWSAPTQARKPLAAKSNLVTQVLFDQGRILEIMMLADLLFPPWLFLGGNRKHFQFIENGLLIRIGHTKRICHAEKKSRLNGKCPFFLRNHSDWHG